MDDTGEVAIGESPEDIFETESTGCSSIDPIKIKIALTSYKLPEDALNQIWYDTVDANSMTAQVDCDYETPKG